MATADAQYSIYAGTFDALRRALEAHDVDRLVILYNAIARLPDAHQSAARLAMKDVSHAGPKRGPDEFGGAA
jgi:hypothetical protein